MQPTAHSDHGTVLPSSSSALVVDKDGQLSLLLGQVDGDQDLPLLVQLLAAVAIRSDDEEWVAEMLAIFDQDS